MAIQSNFQWVGAQASSTIPTIPTVYVDSPIMNEKQSANTDNSYKVAYLDDINIGVFNNFGYLNNSSNFNKDIVEFMKSLNEHFMDLDKRINNIREILTYNNRTNNNI